MKKIFLNMYLKKNLGDDLFLNVISKRYPNIGFYTNTPAKEIKCFHLKNIHGRSFISRIINKILPSTKNIRKYDASVVLGGSMFIENNLTKNELKENIEKKYNTSSPLFILGANFGPYKNNYYNDLHKELFSNANDVCFREKYSAELFKDLKNVRVAPDIIFGLDAKKYEIKAEKKIIISVINLENRKELSKYQKSYESKILELAGYYADQNYEVVLMSFCKAEGDEIAINRILEKAKSENIKLFYYCGNINEALNEIASSEIIIGTRFHSVVLGLVFGKKVLPIIYSKKTTNMLNDINYKGKTISIADMEKLDVKNVENYLYNYGKTDKLSAGSKQHFAKLDESLKEDK